MGAQFAVADIERLVVDEQADDLAVGDVDDGLAGLGVAVAGLGVGQRPDLVEASSDRCPAGRAARPRRGCRASRCARWTARTATPICARTFEVELGLADLPRFDGEGVLGDHGCKQLGEVGHHHVGAVARASPRPGPPCRRPTTKPNLPAWPASTPDMASSNTAAASGATSSNSGRRAGRCRAPACPRCAPRARSTPSTRCWTNRSMPAMSSTARVLALEDTTAMPRPAGRGRLQIAPRAVEHLDAVLFQDLLEHVVLAVAQAYIVSASRGRPGCPRAARCRGCPETTAPRPRASCRRRTSGSPRPRRRGRTCPRCARRVGTGSVEHGLPGLACARWRYR